MESRESGSRFSWQGLGGAVGVKERGMSREKHQELGRSTLLLALFESKR